jgi:hypothetical protein
MINKTLNTLKIAGLTGLTALVLATGSGCSTIRHIQHPAPNYRSTNRTQMQDIPEAPDQDYGSLNCAGYAARTANMKFHKLYVHTDAWDLGYENRVVTQINHPADLVDLVDHNILTPGMLVAFYNPDSWYKDNKDKKRKKVRYTHVAVYAGLENKGKNRGKLMFYHQFHSTIETISYQELLELGLKPVEIIDEKK